MYTRTKTIGPTEAAALLKDHNPRNRPLTAATVAKYASDMRAGQWKENGESISIDTNDDLLNGQHRLHACVESGMPFTTVVVYDVDPETFSSFDCGKARNCGQVLGLMGHKYGNLIASISGRLWQHDNGMLGKNWSLGTTQDKLALIEANPDIMDAAKVAATFKFQQAVMGTIALLFGRKYPTKTKAFLEEVRDGVGLIGKDSPSRRLREKFTIVPKGTRIQQEDAMAYAFVAANAYIENRPLKSLTAKGVEFVVTNGALRARAARAKR